MPALLIDCDGTLAETERDGHRLAFNQAFAEMELDIRWDEQAYAVWSRIPGGKNRLHRYFMRHGLPAGWEDREALVRHLHARKRAHYRRLVQAQPFAPRPGIIELIDSALAARWAVAICTTASADGVRALLPQVLGQARTEALTGIFAGDMVPEQKPHPGIFLMASWRLQVMSKHCIVLEDAPPGVRAAHAAGMYVVASPSMYEAEGDFSLADLLVHSWEEISLDALVSPLLSRSE